MGKKHTSIKELLGDASKKFIDGLEQGRDDVLFGDIIEGAESGADSRKYKKTTILKSLMIEFVLTLLLGYIGIPAMFRRNKVYGLAKFGIALGAVLTLFYFRSWVIMIPAMFLYALDLGIVVSRLVIFYKGKKFAKRFSSDKDESVAEGN